MKISRTMIGILKRRTMIMLYNRFACLTLLGLSIAAVSCTLLDTVEEIPSFPYSIDASCESTKTVNDGISTEWASDDEISVFFVGSQSTSGRFTYDGEQYFNGTFDREIGAGDWYAVYPYSGHISSPTSVKVNMASATLQRGCGSQAHLAGEGFPLFGSAFDVPAGRTPRISMHQFASVAKFIVTNSEPEPLVVEAIEFTAPVDIAGSFTADLTADTPQWTAVGGDSSTNTVVLNVKDAEAIRNGQSAEFFMSFASFAAEGDYTVILHGKSNGIDVCCKKEFHKNWTFSRGAIRPINMNYVRTAVGEESPQPEEPTQPEPSYYELVTSSPSDWSGKYLIVETGNKYAFAALSSGSPSGYRYGVTVSDNKILSDGQVDKYAFDIINSGGKHKQNGYTNEVGYFLKNSDGYYVYGNSGGLIVNSSSNSYLYVIKYNSNGVQMWSGNSNSSVSTQYYLGYSSSKFSFGKSSTSNRVLLYKYTGDPQAPSSGDEGDDEIQDIKNKETYNLESKVLTEYFDAADPLYTDSNWSTVTVIGDFKSAGKTEKSGPGQDVPTPVTLHWLDNSSLTKTVSIYNDEERTDLETSVTTTSSSADIYNLIPGRTYYYSVTSSGSELASGRFNTEGRRRMIYINSDTGYDTANNCRDLGGLRTVDGKQLRYGKIYRGTNINGLNTSEYAYLIDYLNIRADIDLRYKSSSSNAYAKQAFSDSRVTYCNPEFENWTSSTRSLKNKTKIKMTFDCIISTLVAGYSPYIHCYIGSDRTGYICMLLEAACGVTEKDCTMDYEITSFSVAGTKDRASKYTSGANYFNDGIKYIEGYTSTNFPTKSTFQENARRILMDAGITETQLENLRQIMVED